ncbi:VWA domain-containing protein [Myxococcota bacterium]
MIKLSFVTLACLATTSSAAAAQANDVPQIEAVFVLDTTGSMGGLIQAAKEKIWSIASSMAQTDPAPKIKMGLVAYRDRGDAYVTQRTQLTTDLDAVYETLMGFAAQGGGDGPESVNQGLHEAVTMMDWSTAADVYRVVFLVGDFPPHMDYSDDVQYPVTCSLAAEKAIVINTIQCGSNGGTTPVWRDIASKAAGDYFRVDQSGGAIAASTPFDKDLAEASAELDATRLYYGSRKVRAAASKRKKVGEAINAKASVSAKARRATFNTSAAGDDNFYGRNELLRDVETNKVKLDHIETAELPEIMQGMSTKERQRFVDEQAAKRAALQAKVRDLATKRQAHMEEQLKKDAKAAKGALSQKVYDAVRRQAAENDIQFTSETALH